MRRSIQPWRGSRVGAVLLVATAAAACGAGRAGVAPPRPDGGADGVGTIGPPRPLSQPAEDASLPSPADYADVNIPIDFTDPVWLPPPSTDVAGDLTDLVGSWIEVDSSGQPCTAAAMAGDAATGCTHLEIQRGADGAFVGTVYLVRLVAPFTIAGPFPMATDPTVGYPPMVSPSEYWELQSLTVGVRYRVFDGALIDSTFTFWISPLDLWTDWCALQSPSLWNVNGKQKYQCVPQSADTSNTDLGKLSLCTSSNDRQMCASDSSTESCVCVNGSGGAPCGPAACECSASACRAALRSDVFDVTLQLQSGKLVGLLGGEPTTLEKVAP